MKIATYNIENLFDLHFNRTEYVEYIPNTSWQWNAANFRKKVINLSKVICDIDADIIALQEIESRAALKTLQTRLGQIGCHYPHLAIADSKKSTVKVALLSRHPFVYTKELRVTSGLTFRNILEAKLRVNGEALYLFVNHWKSKSGAESKRLVSAKTLRKRLETLGHDNAIILLGDFNSDYREDLLFQRKRRHNDTNGITGINHILKTLTVKAPEELKKCGDCYYNLWYEVNEQTRWSHTFKQYKEALDHIIISAGLMDEKGIEYIKGSFGRYNPDYLLKRGKPYRWQQSRTHPKHHTGFGYSDHLPLFANFEIK